MAIIFHGAARRGGARRGMARRGVARHGAAWQTHCISSEVQKFARHGLARHGKARRGKAWRGEAWQTHCISLEVQKFALARRGAARPGGAWLGGARLGGAWQTHGILRGAAVYQCKKSQNTKNQYLRMLPEITLRLAICANACPIGPRLERGVPLPAYQHTYALEERQQAEADMERVRKYIETHHGKKTK